MQCKASVHYEVKRASTARYWEEPNDYGDIVSIDCAFCDFRVLKRYTPKPKTSKSGQGRYNRMRGIMVAHLHQAHRTQLGQSGAIPAEGTGEMNVSRSKTGLPTIMESGGGMSNTGYATVISGPAGERIQPLWVPRGYSNGDHAGFVARIGMCVIQAEHSREGETVTVRRIVSIGTAENPDELALELVGEWENNDGNIPPSFEDAQNAALDKCYCYHCREPHYSAEGN